MKTTRKDRPQEITVEEAGLKIFQTENGMYIIRPSLDWSQSLIVNKMELGALIRICIHMRNEVEGKNK